MSTPTPETLPSPHQERTDEVTSQSTLRSSYNCALYGSLPLARRTHSVSEIRSISETGCTATPSASPTQIPPAARTRYPPKCGRPAAGRSAESESRY